MSVLVHHPPAGNRARFQHTDSVRPFPPGFCVSSLRVSVCNIEADRCAGAFNCFKSLKPNRHGEEAQIFKSNQRSAKPKRLDLPGCCAFWRLNYPGTSSCKFSSYLLWKCGCLVPVLRISVCYVDFMLFFVVVVIVFFHIFFLIICRDLMGQGLWKRMKVAVYLGHLRRRLNPPYSCISFCSSRLFRKKKKSEPFHPTLPPGQAFSQGTTLNNSTRGNVIPLRDLGTE